LVAVGADQVQLQRGHLVVGDVGHLPHLVVEPGGTAVQGVRAVVERKLVGRAVEGEGAARDAVAVAADQGAEVGVVVRDVAGQVVEPEDDVVHLAVRVGNLQRLDDPAPGEHLHRDVAIGHGPALHRGAVRRGAERLDARRRAAARTLVLGDRRGDQASGDQADRECSHERQPAAPPGTCARRERN
jgi:hypothetical protein